MAACSGLSALQTCGGCDTLAIQQRDSNIDTLVSGQAQQIFLGFVLGLSEAVADSGISELPAV